MKASTLAEVEAAIAELGGQDPQTIEDLIAQRDLWESTARGYAAGIRRIHRHLILLRAHFPTTTRYTELTHVIAEVVAPELVDQEPVSSGGEQR